MAEGKRGWFRRRKDELFDDDELDAAYNTSEHAVIEGDEPDDAWAPEEDAVAEVVAPVQPAEPPALDATSAPAAPPASEPAPAPAPAPVPPPRPLEPMYRLAEAEERHAAHPRSFFIPTPETRAGLQVGQRAALLFYALEPQRGRPEAERMWVEVTERGTVGYRGRLLNRPAVIPGLSLHDELRFGPENVIRVEDQRWAPYERQVAFVNARLLTNDGLEPGFVLHDAEDAGEPLEPGGPTVSGWQLLVGDETQADLDDPDALKTPALNWVMERYPAFGALVFSGARDGEWVYDPATKSFRSDAS